MNWISRLAARARAASLLVVADGLNRGLTTGAIRVFILKGWAAGFGIVATWILSRSSTPAEFGTYASVLSVVALLGIPVALGFDSYLVPATARLLVQQRYGLLRGLLQRSRELTLVASLVLVLTGAVLPLPALLGIAVGPYLLGLASMPVAAMSRLRQATLTGLHHAIEGQLPENLVRPSVLALVAAALVISLGHLTGLSMVAANLTAVAAAYGTGWLLQRRYMPLEVTRAKREYETAGWTRASIHFVVLTGANQVMLNVPLIAVGVIRGPAEAALFAMASKLAFLVLFGYEAVNTVLAPASAKLWAEGDSAQLQRTVTFTARLALISTLPPAIVFLVAGEWVLGFFGPAYALAGSRHPHSRPDAECGNGQRDASARDDRPPVTRGSRPAGGCRSLHSACAVARRQSRCEWRRAQLRDLARRREPHLDGTGRSQGGRCDDRAWAAGASDAMTGQLLEPKRSSVVHAMMWRRR
jgi:O-antigen/teichoic acid export membrane protein